MDPLFWWLCGGVLLVTCGWAQFLGVGSVWLLLVGVFFLSFQMFYVPVFLQSLFLFCASIVLRKANKPAVFHVVALVSTLSIAGWFQWRISERLAARENARQRHPFVSLAGRLDELHADQPRPAGAPAVAESLIRLPERSEQELAVIEEVLDASYPSYRTHALETLHDRTYDRFVRSPGFGGGRMARTTRNPERYVDMSAAPPLPQSAQYEKVCVDVQVMESEPALAQFAPTADDLGSLHSQSYDDFANPLGFGLVRDVEHVAGFEPHRFREVPALPEEDALTQRWDVVRLELVSLLKHAEPAVYISEYLPSMELLKDAPTRPLNVFEATALGDLRAGENLVVQHEPTTIRMLGAVRAAKQCLDCHSVERGRLLGAFTYVLQSQAD